jgi:CRP-like cAMP-binding protein
LKAGDFFGEVALLQPQPRIATVRAATPCTLLELSRDRLLPYLEKAPHLKDMLETTTQIRILDTRRAREKR